ncbi:heme exporter protein CcmD [Motiliproteus sp. SC1-56]|uniref:heme exporter protein CcmD n=1 Tax=Motiliproteus sp. SC1-56 TaxID=2799565 RepID=UPI001A8EE34B|nr:heme exporter protein CcmD [Motiliproteus sp. SC1-56]
MYFDSFSEFLAMGGHGPYVWACYALASVIIGFNVISPLMAKKQFLSEQARRLRRERRAAGKES